MKVDIAENDCNKISFVFHNTIWLHMRAFWMREHYDWIKKLRISFFWNQMAISLCLFRSQQIFVLKFQDKIMNMIDKLCRYYTTMAWHWTWRKARSLVNWFVFPGLSFVVCTSKYRKVRVLPYIDVKALQRGLNSSFFVGSNVSRIEAKACSWSDHNEQMASWRETADLPRICQSRENCFKKLGKGQLNPFCRLSTLHKGVLGFYWRV